MEKTRQTQGGPARSRFDLATLPLELQYLAGDILETDPLAAHYLLKAALCLTASGEAAVRSAAV